MFDWFVSQPWSCAVTLAGLLIALTGAVHLIGREWFDGNWDDVE